MKLVPAAEKLAFIRGAHAAARAGFEDCIMWRFSTRQDYGAPFTFTRPVDGAKRLAAAHVASLVMWSGRDRTGDGLQVAHWHCGEPACINPLHLRWSTPAENVADTFRQERHYSQRYRTRLLDRHIIDMRVRCAGGETCQALAEEFGLREVEVWRIVRGFAYAFVRTGPFPAVPRSPELLSPADRRALALDEKTRKRMARREQRGPNGAHHARTGTG